MIPISLSWYFTSILVFFLLSMPANLALEFNLSIQENNKCIESERQALLSFKRGLVDRYNILSSWTMQVNNDCCNWRGVRCSHNTGHIVRLGLRGSYDKHLEGKVGSSLAQLSHLNYLDLSHNHFDQIFLEDIGFLINLNYLNLSYNWFEGAIPPHLENLSKLSVLDLGYISNLSINVHDNLRWLSSLSSLKHLDLSFVDFLSANNWASIINKLTLIQSLSLRGCNVPQPVLPSHSYTNFSRFLVKLDLSDNNLNSSIYPWLINFRSNLTYLDLAFNNLQNLNVDDFGNLTFLVFLDLSFTRVGFRSTKSFENFCNLKSLYLLNNNMGGFLYDFLKNFPQCALNSLQYLHVASNKFLGFLPNFTIFPSLKGLDLSNNTLNGTIPQSLGQLCNLEYLHLGQNSLNGEIYEAHLSKLTNLQALNLSGNFLNLNFKFDWVPPFQLKYMFLRSCKLGPLFPKWFQTQNFSFLDISYAKISDTIPHWFWNNLSPGLKFMDLSGNKIKGEIPNLSINFKHLLVINLQSNEFVGQIPPFLLQAYVLDLSNNKFSGVTYLCEATNSPLYLLDLSNNQLSGQLPNCWDHILQLDTLHLANNTFSGDIPYSLGNLTRLRYLNLRNNQFSGELPHWFNFTDLIVFDAMHNNLSGIIPSWIGFKLPNLVHLNLKSNKFHGNLPSSLCNLRSINVLDISSNNITGSIPTCIHNYNGLTQKSDSPDVYDMWVDEVFDFHMSAPVNYIGSFRVAYHRDLAMVWKGQERIINGEVLLFERSIDLSCNHLTGKIPDELTQLVGLITLNLSRNELTGQIPDKMGQLHLFESLDLSRNYLSGPIPPSFSQMSMLSALNLSYNNLFGQIPTGTQLQGFEASSYEGNPCLCGAPLKKCYEEDIQQQSINKVHVENENEDKLIIREFLISMSFGFIVGFWGIFGSLVLHRRWRHAYFKFFRDTIDKVT